MWIMVAATSSQGEGFDFLAKGKARALKCAKALNQQLRVVFNSAFLFVGYKIVPEVVQDWVTAGEHGIILECGMQISFNL